MLPQKIAFIDLETTGLRSFYDRIIEIGILRVENNQITKTYHSLINPQTYLPKEIETITGITSKDLDTAPTFREIMDEILETIQDCVFVAHNVRFDYSFLKSELKRHNISFTSKHFCTVRLSRLLYPSLPRHNLDALIERFNLQCEARHRALADATVLYHFYQKVQQEFPSEKIAEAIGFSLKKPSLPLKLQASDLENLPEQPGVYLFYGENGMPLYVGKSINVRGRVLDHFSSDIRSPIEMKISQQIESIETITTAGELGALFLESQLIKKLLPLYNKKSRIKKELIALKSKTNSDGYQECFLEPITSINPDELDTFLGFFKSRKQAKSYLAELTKKHTLCEKLLGLEKTKGPCFAYRLNHCKGACIGIEKALLYNMRFIMAFAATKIKTWPFPNAIIIEEKELEGTTEYFLINNWCLLGSIIVDHQGNQKTNLTGQMMFDLDMYQILKQYLKNATNVKKVKQIPQEQIPTFFEEITLRSN